jgi:hypothetical protein
MTRAMIIGAICSAALTSGMSAQAPGSVVGTPDQPPMREITVTGCLKPGEVSGSSSSGGAATAATGTGSIGAAAPGFVLTNGMPASATQVKSEGGTAGKVRTEAGGTGTSESVSMTSYRLQGGDAGQLRQYLHSTVEVRGTVLSSSNAMTSAASTAATSGPTGTAGATGAGASATRESGATPILATVHVTSVRQLASTCTP